MAEIQTKQAYIEAELPLLRKRLQVEKESFMNLELPKEVSERVRELFMNIKMEYFLSNTI